MSKNKPSILYFDLAPYYRMEINIDGSVNIYSDHVRSKGRKLAQWFTHDGYLRTKLQAITKTIHSIVAECALGPRPEGLVINHIDGNKLNNHPNNLEYCTIAENIRHAINLGLHVASDPTRNGSYIDGRSLDSKQYKHSHYVANKQLYLERAKAFYKLNKQRILAERKLRYKENVSD